MPPRLPDDKRAAILNDIRAGGQSARQIADKHGVAPSTVSKLAKDAGLTDAFERSQTKSATAAIVADSRARRAELASLALDDAQEMRQRALMSTTSRDAMQYATAYGIFIDKHLVLDRHDVEDETGLAAVDQWLRSVMGG